MRQWTKGKEYARSYPITRAYKFSERMTRIRRMKQYAMPFRYNEREREEYAFHTIADYMQFKAWIATCNDPNLVAAMLAEYQNPRLACTLPT